MIFFNIRKSNRFFYIRKWFFDIRKYLKNIKTLPHIFLISWNILDLLISQIRFFDIRNLNSWPENPLYIPISKNQISDIKNNFQTSYIPFLISENYFLIPKILSIFYINNPIFWYQKISLTVNTTNFDECSPTYSPDKSLWFCEHSELLA